MAIKWVIEEPIFGMFEEGDISTDQADIWLTAEELDIYLDEIQEEFDLDSAKLDEMAEESRAQAENRLKRWKKRMKSKFPETKFWWDTAEEEE